MSKLKSLTSASITSLGTAFAGAVTTVSGAAAGYTAQKMVEMGDYNAAAIPLTAAFMTMAWGAMTYVGAKAAGKEWAGVFTAGPQAPSHELSGPDA